MRLDEAAEALVDKAIAMALGGDPVAVRFCLGRLLGMRRGQPVVFDDVADFPEVAGPEDLAAAIAAVTRAVAEGRLTPEEALHLSEMLHGFAPVFDAVRASAPPEEDRPGPDPREVLKKLLSRIAEARRRGPPPDDDPPYRSPPVAADEAEAAAWPAGLGDPEEEMAEGAATAASGR